MLKDVEAVGRKNEVREVADGYARNFLIPNGLAKQATESVVKQAEIEKEAIAKKAEADLKTFEEQASLLDGQEFEISAKIGENGKLFAAVTAAKVAKALKDRGFDVKRTQIRLDDPIKEVGEYDDILVEFPHGLEAKIKVIVVEEIKE